MSNICTPADLRRAVKLLKNAASQHDTGRAKEDASVLAAAVEDLITIVTDYERLVMAITQSRLPPEVRAELFDGCGYFLPGGLADISGLLWAAATLGPLVVVNPVMRAQLEALRTAPARKERRKRADRAAFIINKFADEFCAHNPGLHDKIQIARKIAPMVHEELGPDYPRYIADTIARKIKTPIDG